MQLSSCNCHAHRRRIPQMLAGTRDRAACCPSAQQPAQAQWVWPLTNAQMNLGTAEEQQPNRAIRLGDVSDTTCPLRCDGKYCSQSRQALADRIATGLGQGPEGADHFYDPNKRLSLEQLTAYFRQGPGQSVASDLQRAAMEGCRTAHAAYAQPRPTPTPLKLLN